jgi:hypothetical protein
MGRIGFTAAAKVIAGGLFGCLALAAPVMADGIEEYSALRTAQSLDDLCRVLKFVERKAIDEVGWDQIRTTTQYSFWQTDRMTNEEYQAWLDGLDAAADAKADELGCTPAAEAYLLKARGVASAAILQGLILAHHLAGLPEGDMLRRPLSAEAMQAAGAYEGFLQQVYREQFPAFLEANKQAAAVRLPGNGMPACDALTPPNASQGVSGGALDDEYYERMNDVTGAAQIADDVLFEVAAETAGYRVVGSWTQKAYLVPHIMASREFSLFASVIDNGRTFKLDGGGEVFGVIAERDGLLRFMTYGADAEKLRTGAVRFLVRTEPKPEGTADWEVFNLTDFRSLTSPFEGVLLDERCLGGPCYEFPAQTTEAMLEMGFDEKAELWLSASADAAPAATSDWTDRNVFYPQLLYRMHGKSPPSPAASPAQ